MVLEFIAPLPKEFELQLIARAFGPNAEKEFEVRVGNNISKFNLSEIDELRTFKIKNPDESNILRIKVPNPISPRKLMQGEDDRNLGLGLVELKVIY